MGNIALLNDEPEDLLNGYELKRAAVRDMLLYGSGYIYIDRDGGGIRSLRSDAAGISVKKKK